MDCLFCKIANKGRESETVYEDEKFFAFKDINPKAPIHVLIIPKQHIESVNHLQEEDVSLVGELILVTKKVAEKFGIANSGYRLQINVGKGGGQIIDHLHVHLMGGW